MIQKETAPAKTVARPSRMKIHAWSENYLQRTSFISGKTIKYPSGFAADAVHVGDSSSQQT